LPFKGLGIFPASQRQLSPRGFGTIVGTAVPASQERPLSYQAATYRILVASPGDLVAERVAIPEVIHAWNAEHSEAESLVLLPVLWESHAVPEMGDRPQAIINKQLVENCDVLIGAFWTRIGTHTGLAESGTVEEIEEFIKAGKPVLLYFSSVPVALDSVDQDQYSRLKEFRKKVEAGGLVQAYESIPDLRDKLGRHLTATARRLRGPKEAGPAVQLPPRRAPSRAALFRARMRGVGLEQEQLLSVLNRLERDWATERDVQPVSLDTAKQILRTLAAGLLDFRVLLGEGADEQVAAALDQAVRVAKSLQDYQLYLDGGASYRQFWLEGDRAFEGVRSVLRPPSELQVLKAARENDGVFSVQGDTDDDYKAFALVEKALMKLRDRGLVEWLRSVPNGMNPHSDNVKIQVRVTAAGEDVLHGEPS
jgi:uncharacterized protein (DUF1330 family)